MNNFRQILIERLEKMGMETGIIPGFLRSLATTMLLNSQMNLLQVNKRLHWLGWDGFELDYHTFQLALVCIEADGLKNPTKEPAPQ